MLTALSIAVNEQTQDLVFPTTDKIEITSTSSGSGNTILDRIGEGVYDYYLDLEEEERERETLKR